MEEITLAIKRAVETLSTRVGDIVLEHPRDENHGDYSSNVAMLVAKKAGKSPREVASQIVVLLQKDTQINSLIGKIEVAGAGFINFWLKEEWLDLQVEEARKGGYGRGTLLKNKRVMVEYTDPNPFKEFHIGHLMSNTVGESLARLFEAQGAMIHRVCYQGDVGLHVAKAIWGYTHQKSESTGIARWGKAYAYGATLYETSKEAKAEIEELNKTIYTKSNDAVNKLYNEGREASLAYFETLYQRLGTKFDDYFFESEAGDLGLKVVEEGIKAGILEEGEEGAIVFRGERYGLHTRVFRNSAGLPTYEGKELGLVGAKNERWQYDLSFIVTANEIDEYFKVLMKVLELMRPDLSKKTKHISHGIMKLKSGKMSSRTGKVVTGEALLDELVQVVLVKMGTREVSNKNHVADQVAVGALKWTVLKHNLGGDIVYEPERMTKLEGDTGPYVQYTYARAQSVLKKGNSKQQAVNNKVQGVNSQELGLKRWIYRYPEVVVNSAREYAPHYVAHYLLELAGRFNSFYAKSEIAGHKERLALTAAVALTLKKGLGLLGIEAPEEM